MYRAHLTWKPIAVLLLLALTWGANMAFIKFAARDVTPLFMAGLRSAVASVVVFLWMRQRGIRIFPSAMIIWHGLAVGTLFASEFALIYIGLQYTLASRIYILVYTAPFFVAFGAHFLLDGDRLSGWKAAGLIVAFGGVTVLFVRGLGAGSLQTLPGDVMALVAGALWGATTLYIKKYLAHRTNPLQTLFYQLFFSIPILLGLSFLLEESIVSGFSLLTGFSLFYQCIVVASVSFIFWFELIHRHPVSLLHAFTFFVPVFGVFLSGALMLGETITLRLVIALTLVSIGMVMVNYRPHTLASSRSD
jgi:drug/metabolite transporter (DMT)-like permease